MSVSLSTQPRASSPTQVLPKPKIEECVPSRLNPFTMRSHPDVSTKGLNISLGVKSISVVQQSQIRKRMELIGAITAAKTDIEKSGKKFSVLIDSDHRTIFFVNTKETFQTEVLEEEVFDAVTTYCTRVGIALEEEEALEDLSDDEEVRPERTETKTAALNQEEDIVEIAQAWRCINSLEDELSPLCDLEINWDALSAKQQEALVQFCAQNDLSLNLP